MSPRFLHTCHYLFRILAAFVGFVGVFALCTIISKNVYTLAGTTAVSLSSVEDSQIEPTSVPTLLVTNKLIFLPLIAQQARPQRSVTHKEIPPHFPVMASGSNNSSLLRAPAASKYTFVADTGGNLDQYLYRSDLADGRLKFTINITAPVIISDSLYIRDGWLTDVGFH